MLQNGWLIINDRLYISYFDPQKHFIEKNKIYQKMQREKLNNLQCKAYVNRVLFLSE
jgi:hypothetical protein